MTFFRVLWQVHKWAGITLGTVLVLSAVTGFLLLQKKDHDWIQPPTAQGTMAPIGQVRPLAEVLDAVYAIGHPAFREEADIDRIEFRLGKRIHKIRSHHDHLEMQVDAVTLKVHPVQPRRSDLLEDIHDGSFFAPLVHEWVMPLVALGTVLLAMTGYAIWILPIVRKRRRRKKQA